MGAFSPSLLKTPQFEVAFKHHAKGESWPLHYQRKATEYNLVVRGRIQMGRQVFHAGELFEVPPLVPMKPRFLTNVEVVVVKIPSLPGDKVSFG